LGSSTSKEAREIFEEYQKNLLEYKWAEGSNEFIELAFSKHKRSERKDWIQKRTGKENFVPRKNIVTLNEFFNCEFIQFSISDCIRSIPNLMDGLKPSQRKILYGFLKKNTLQEQKVDQIRGFISECSLYAHGDTSLNETIISMNQDFVGSNNINLCIPCGAFGTRLQGGKDAASPRYISTKLNSVTLDIFSEKDEPLLKYNYEGDIQIEPEYYMPILPMLFVNGSVGIGTGYSCDVPCYRPSDLINYLCCMLEGKPTFDLMPWYRGFKGKIIKGVDHYITQGCFESKGSKSVWIQELPIGVWTQKYKEFLETLIEQKVIVSFLDHSTEKDICIQVNFTKANLETKTNEQLIQLLKLQNGLKLNLTLFDEHHKLHKYTSIHQVLKHFYDVRLNIYRDRLDVQIKKLEEEKKRLSAKVYFIQHVISNDIKIFKKSRLQVVEQLKKTPIKDMYFKLCLDLPIHHFTNEKVEECTQELNEHNKTLVQLKKTTEKELWLNELQRILEILDKSEN